MAIDLSDAKALVRGQNADEIYKTIIPVPTELPFMKGAHITLIYGPIDDNSPMKTIEL